MVCYHFGHYLAYMRKTEGWVLFDDIERHVMEKGWETVVNQCVNLGSKPTIIMFEKLENQDNFEGVDN